MLKLNMKKILLLILALLPLQVTLRMIFNLPVFLLLIYPFIILATIYLIINRKKIRINKYLFKYILIILIIFYCEMVISVLFGLQNVIDTHIPFQYYVKKYSFFWDGNVMSSIFAGIIRPFVYFYFFIIINFIIKSENDIKKLVKYLLLIALISSIYSIYQLIAFKLGLPYSSICSGHDGDLITFSGIRRCEGLFYEPGPHATFLSVIFAILFCQKKSAFFAKTQIWWLLIILITFSMFITWSPIGILTPFLSLIFLIFLKWNSISKKLKKTILFLFLGIVLILPNIFSLIENSSNMFIKTTIEKIAILNYKYDTNIQGGARSNRNYIGTCIFLNNNKLLGIGPGNDGFYYPRYGSFATGWLPDKGIVLNNNLKILVDSGILGFLIYCILLIFPALYNIKIKLYKKKTTKFLDNFINSMFLSEFLLVFLTFTSQVEFFQPLFWMVYSLLCISIILKIKYLKNGDFIYENN